ncbi:type II toxin-antitoxin system RelE/ParE family toxin [Nonlabens sp.]|uniref:type II toxin-antitoxin system RelE/ParE family toxin n=1 Tax=Nonlabens sp. TaxID=1888209 RepID=UPI003F694E24
MRIIWSAFAETQLDEIYEYYKNKAGKRIAKKLIYGLINEPNKLLKSPFIGQEEELLKDRKADYRYLVYKNYKLIYSLEEKTETIKIADVFDSRQTPNKLKRTK